MNLKLTFLGLAVGLLEPGALEAAALEPQAPGALAPAPEPPRAVREPGPTAAGSPLLAQTAERAVGLVERPLLAFPTLAPRLATEVDGAAPRCAPRLHGARAPPGPGRSCRGFSSIV